MCMRVAAEGNSNRPPRVRPSLGLLLPRHSSALPQWGRHGAGNWMEREKKTEVGEREGERKGEGGRERCGQDEEKEKQTAHIKADINQILQVKCFTWRFRTFFRLPLIKMYSEYTAFILSVVQVIKNSMWFMWCRSSLEALHSKQADLEEKPLLNSWRPWEIVFPRSRMFARGNRWCRISFHYFSEWWRQAVPTRKNNNSILQFVHMPQMTFVCIFLTTDLLIVMRLMTVCALKQRWRKSLVLYQESAFVFLSFFYHDHNL